MVSLSVSPETTLIMTFLLRSIEQSVPCSHLYNVVLNFVFLSFKSIMSAHLQLIQLMCYTCGQNIAVHEKKKKRNTSTPTIIVSNASHMINGVRLSKDLQLGDNTQFHPKYLNWALTEKGNIGIEVVEVGTGRKSLSNKTGIKNWFVYFDNFCILVCFFNYNLLLHCIHSQFFF